MVEVMEINGCYDVLVERPSRQRRSRHYLSAIFIQHFLMVLEEASGIQTRPDDIFSKFSD